MESRKEISGTIFIAVAILTAFVFMTMIRNETWRSTMTLWKDVIAKSPESPAGYINVAREYQLSGNKQAAFENYQLAAQYAQMRGGWHSRAAIALAQSNMGGLLLSTGKPEDRAVAVMALKGAMSLYPYYGPAVQYLATIYNQDGKYSETITLIDATIANGFGPGFSGVSGSLYLQKGVALCALGFSKQANENFAFAVANYPDMQSLRCE